MDTQDHTEETPQVLDARERRNDDRYQLLFHVQVHDADGRRPLGYLVDVSRGGLMLATEEPLETNRRYRLRIPLPIAYLGCNEIELDAIAAWSAPSMHPAYYRTGFRDLSLEPAQREVLDRLVEDYHMYAAD